jgi:dihydroorotate dehydrogenase
MSKKNHKKIDTMNRTLIHGIDFGPIWAMSGLLNFYGQGWPYHKGLKILGINFKNVTLVSKTTTLLANEGNMPLRQNLMPKELIPISIYLNRKYMCALNAISLSGPGAHAIVGAPEFKKHPAPFQFSFMSVAKLPEQRLIEAREFVEIIVKQISRNIFISKFGVQINETCPNTGHNNSELEEILQRLEIFYPLVGRGIPIIVKVSVEMPIENIMRIGQHPNCHGICTSNTVRFGKLEEKIDWKKLFPKGSPLEKRGLNIPGAGGLSGAPLLPLVVEQIKNLRKAGFTKHINGGGGILYKKDVDEMHQAGANSISLGSVAFLNPLAIPGIKRRAMELFKV